MTKTVITFGTFDLFHIGHLNLLRRAAQLGDRLIVGVSSDNLSYQKKAKFPIFNERARLKILDSLKWVDAVFIEESLEKKEDYILDYDADILVMGDDWQGKFDHFSNLSKIVYLPRTTGISTSEILETIQGLHKESQLP